LKRRRAAHSSARTSRRDLPLNRRLVPPPSTTSRRKKIEPGCLGPQPGSVVYASAADSATLTSFGRCEPLQPTGGQTAPRNPRSPRRSRSAHQRSKIRPIRDARPRSLTSRRC
jgi:hypothetical protein